MGQAAETHIEETLPWIATLTRGRSYTLGTDKPMHFVRGVETPVDESTKTRLERKAVQMVRTGTIDEDGEEEYEPRCKFIFRKAGEPASKVEPRERSRSGAAVKVHKS
jgi:hypothetical protein